MMFKAKIVMRPQRAAREHVEHAEDAAGIRWKTWASDLRIDAGQRDIGAEPVDHQRAPSVNQMRFLSSVALEKAEKLMLTASCSAADAMLDHPRALASPNAFRPAPAWRRCHDHRAPELFDRFDRGLGCALDLDGERRLELALGQEPHAIADPAQNAGGDERGAVDGRVGLDPAGVERGLQAAEIDDMEMLAERRAG